MECYPPCRTCTGLCKSPVPARRVVPSSGGTTPRTRRKPVTPKKMPGYIILICGTATTLEEQRMTFQLLERRFPANVTGKTKLWCEKHSHWAKLYTFAERVADNAVQLPF